MALSPTRIRTLRRHAREGSLEVEHVVQVALDGGPAELTLLEELIPDKPDPANLNPWKLAAARFLTGGCPGLLEYATEPSRLPFVVGILENVKTPHAVSTLLSLTLRFSDSAHRIVSAINLLLAFEPAPALPLALGRDVRTFLHAQIHAATSDSDRATAILALRGVGDQTSLDLLEHQPPFKSPYQNTLVLARKAIRRRQVTSERLN